MKTWTPIEVYVNDIQVKNYFSFIWTDRYDTPGDFELLVPYSNENASIFSLGSRITCNLSRGIMLIEEVIVSVSAENGRVMNVKGRSIESILSNRVVPDTLTIQSDAYVNDKFINAFREICDSCFSSMADVMTARNGYTPNVSSAVAGREMGIDYIHVAWDPQEHIKDSNVSIDATGKDLLALLEENCQLMGFGFRLLDGNILEIYDGRDKSNEIIYSEDEKNLSSVEYGADSKEYKNYAFIQGEEYNEHSNYIEIDGKEYTEEDFINIDKTLEANAVYVNISNERVPVYSNVRRDALIDYIEPNGEVVVELVAYAGNTTEKWAKIGKDRWVPLYQDGTLGPNFEKKEKTYYTTVADFDPEDSDKDPEYYRVGVEYPKSTGGLERREIYLTSSLNRGHNINEKYAKRLAKEGLLELATKHRMLYSASCEVMHDTELMYQHEFELGDIVGIQFYPIILPGEEGPVSVDLIKMRVKEYTISHSESGLDLYPTLEMYDPDYWGYINQTLQGIDDGSAEDPEEGYFECTVRFMFADGKIGSNEGFNLIFGQSEWHPIWPAGHTPTPGAPVDCSLMIGVYNTQYSGDWIQIPGVTPSKEHYTFDGWYNGTHKYVARDSDEYEADQINSADYIPIGFNGTITYTAKYIPEKYIATFNRGDHGRFPVPYFEEASIKKEVTYGMSPIPPAVLPYNDPSSEQYAKNTSDIWKSNTYYKLESNLSGKNVYVLLSSRPSDWYENYGNYYIKVGYNVEYTFVGWYSREFDGHPVIEPTPLPPITEDISYTAYWSEKPITVQVTWWSGSHGTFEDPEHELQYKYTERVQKGTDVTSRAPSLRPSSDEWRRDESNPWEPKLGVVINDIAFTAQWVKEDYDDDDEIDPDPDDPDPSPWDTIPRPGPDGINIPDREPNPENNPDGESKKEVEINLALKHFVANASSKGDIYGITKNKSYSDKKNIITDPGITEGEWTEDGTRYRSIPYDANEVEVPYVESNGENQATEFEYRTEWGGYWITAHWIDTGYIIRKDIPDYGLDWLINRGNWSLFCMTMFRKGPNGEYEGCVGKWRWAFESRSKVGEVAFSTIPIFIPWRGYSKVENFSSKLFIPGVYYWYSGGSYYRLWSMPSWWHNPTSQEIYKRKRKGWYVGFLAQAYDCRGNRLDMNWSADSESGSVIIENRIKQVLESGSWKYTGDNPFKQTAKIGNQVDYGLYYTDSGGVWGGYTEHEGTNTMYPPYNRVNGWAGISGSLSLWYWRMSISDCNVREVFKDSGIQFAPIPDERWDAEEEESGNGYYFNRYTLDNITYGDATTKNLLTRFGGVYSDYDDSSTYAYHTYFTNGWLYGRGCGGFNNLYSFYGSGYYSDYNYIHFVTSPEHPTEFDPRIHTADGNSNMSTATNLPEPDYPFTQRYEYVRNGNTWAEDGYPKNNWICKGPSEQESFDYLLKISGSYTQSLYCPKLLIGPTAAGGIIGDIVYFMAGEELSILKTLDILTLRYQWQYKPSGGDWTDLENSLIPLVSGVHTKILTLRITDSMQNNRYRCKVQYTDREGNTVNAYNGVMEGGSNFDSYPDAGLGIF